MEFIVFRTRNADMVMMIDEKLYAFNKTDTVGVFKRGAVIEPHEGLIQVGGVGRGTRYDYNVKKGLLTDVPVYCASQKITPIEYWSGKANT